MLRVKVGARALRNSVGRGGGWVPQGTLGVGWREVGSASSEPGVPSGRAERRRLFTGGTLGVGWVVLC